MNIFIDSQFPIINSELPTEILFHIFLFCSPKELGNCSRVCKRWKQIIDSILNTNHRYWQQYCIKDFGKLAKSAYYKSQCGSSWRKVYRSLTLWPALLRTQESRNEFATSTNVIDEIYGIQVLQKGIVGVHKRNFIEYYYIKDLKPMDEPIVTGNYIKYMENEDTRVFQSMYFHLFVVRKYVTEKEFQHNTTFNDVKLFKLMNRFVYFVKRNNDLCVCNLNDSKFSTSVLCTVPNDLVTITVCNTNLYILTKMYNIHVYEMDKRKLYIIENLKNNTNPFNTLRKYGFLDEIDQNAYYPWMNFRVFVPTQLTVAITNIKTYGNIAFVGTKYGNLKIYHIKSDEDISFLETKPIKEYNFRKNREWSMCVHQIDVVEGEDQHTVLVALENKVISLNFSHNFK